MVQDDKVQGDIVQATMSRVDNVQVRHCPGTTISRSDNVFVFSVLSWLSPLACHYYRQVRLRGGGLAPHLKT